MSQQLTPEQQALIQEQLLQIENIVTYCRQKERQVKGFGHATLDQLANQNNMPADLKEQIKDLINNPEKKFTAKFNINKK